METIKVNMNPNPLDVQTIHASQNDGEARQWKFELHNNGELIDTSSVTEQMFFKAYKGGTEQLLPENTSTPTTSPFKGDIKYPQGLLTDQEFLYRQSPTEKDGLAKITDIKGNTLVWNQLVQNGNFSNTDNWGVASATDFAVSDGVASFTATASNGRLQKTSYIDVIQGHKYLATAEVKISSGFAQFYGTNSNNRASTTKTGVFERLFILYEEDTTRQQRYFPRVVDRRTADWDAIEVKNVMLFDLTQMGLDISSASEFTSLFPLPFYQFEQGKLLSFNGNGIKTVSKNQFDTQVVTTSYAGLVLTKTQGTIRAVYSGGSQYAGFNFYGSPVFTDTFLKGKYRLSFDVSGLDTQWTVGLRQGPTFVGVQAIAISNDGHYSFTIDAEANPNCYLSFARTGNKTTAYDVTFSNIQLELGTTETSYTPFEEKTISLPISQYFPTGMKSAGSAYDELSDKAITRVGAIVLDGTQTPRLTGVTANQVFSFDSLLNTAPCKTVNVNMIGTYELGASYSSTSYTNNRFAFSTVATPLLIYPSGKFADVDALKTYLTSNPVTINYELATPTETSFTTASLVTENEEIPLSNEDGVLVGKCTEQLSSESGFFDAKIKLSDADGECYSNKIQLHVERKPS